MAENVVPSQQVYVEIKFSWMSEHFDLLVALYEKPGHRQTRLD